MTATIINHLGATLTGQIKVWMGRRIVEIETSDGARHVGRLTPDAAEIAVAAAERPMSTVDGAR